MIDTSTSVFLDGMWRLLPWLGLVLLLPLLIGGGSARLLLDRFGMFAPHRMLNQFLLVDLVPGGLLPGILVLPVSEVACGHLLSLLGLLLSIIIAC